ncbi:sigma-70 family RNA polymerase sigma factor [Mesobacillus subterraneus]|uniref:sigma-70 family RNA polymerase sigma factor n=1 Tax=Mesobacillus subterraneus TaxID=285983 RepID=UPI00273F4E93|nr:sigma-70 family RNA polymerase sigma factor [Mesobacillus subterraneus]WLR57444.1 sigma-70 family RNA polymerase sigma factor [Mesobacillus subterraneus]
MYIDKLRKVDTAKDKGFMDHYQNLKRYCQFLTQSSWDGDDLVQDVTVKAIRHYEPSQISSALLKKMAYNHWVDTVRKRSREITGIPEDLASFTSGNVMDTVEMILAKLTPKQAVILVLKEAFRFQSREIAELLQTSEMAVKAVLHRSRKRLERDVSLREVDREITEDEEKLLSDLLCESLQSEDPTVLLENIHEIPTLASCSPEMSLLSYSPLSSFKMAA